MGPTFTASSRPRALVRKRTAWPAAGASRTIRSAAFARSSCFTLPSTRMSLIPGAAVATTSTAPLRIRRRERRRMPCSSRYSTRATSGVIVRARTSAVPSAVAGESSCSSYSSAGAPKVAARPAFPSTSTSSADKPSRAAMRARAAETVVLPTPPFPATMTSRDWRQNPRGSNHPPRRTSIRRLPIVLVVLGSLVLVVAPRGAVAAAARAVDVIEVSGRIDPIEADFVRRAVRQAERDDDEVLVIQLDSPGDLLEGPDLDVLAFRISHARVPVAVWVGPSGARAYGGAARLLLAAAVAGMAQGTHVGRSSGAFPADPLATRQSLGADAARARGAVSVVAPTLGEFIVGLDGRTVGDRTLSTARVVPQGRLLRRQAAGDVRFAKLGLVERVLHAAASPQVAYLLLVAGLLLIVFEFFTAGVGLAGITGAVAIVLAAFGLAVLPTRGLGLGLIGVGVAGLAIDVQAGAPRAWTVIGTAALAAGSWTLFPRSV